MSVPLRPGDVIDGVYAIERLLGKGGMGAVYVAREERLARRVAIKVLLDEAKANPGAVQRFEREARSAASLQSDHVTRVLNVGHLSGGTPYFVMELLEGEDLAAVLSKRGRLAVAEVVSYITQVCEALAEAHALGIVHRDLKPANIFLARRPTGATTVKVLDFGISKGATGSSLESLTATSAVMGTPYYMSPEQLRESKSVDARTDIWALGVVMYELLSGRPPFTADTLADLCVLISNENPRPLGTQRPDVTPALDAIVKRCLEKDAAHRFATVKELMVALTLSTSAAAPNAPASLARARTAPLDVRSMPTQLDDGLGAAPAQTPRGATVPLDRGSEPRGGTVPLDRASAPRQVTVPLDRGSEPRPQVLARTVDPVASTNAALAPRSTRILGLVGVGATAAVVGGGMLYVLLLRQPAEPVSAAAISSTAEAPSASSTPSAQTLAQAPTIVVASSTAPSRPEAGTGFLPLTSSAPVVARPPPTSAPALAAPAVTTPAPAASSTRAPAEPGSLMPGARN